ncbi:cytochrome b/b6 domain-containing protein [soil metagenome]
MRRPRHDPEVPQEIRKKHPLAIRWFHWVNFPVLALMIWSGLLILWANNVFTLFGHKVLSEDFFKMPLGKKDWSLEFRLAEGMSWHFLLAWFFTINGVLYVLYNIFSGEWRHIVPNRHSIKEAFQTVLHDLHIRKAPLPPAKFNGAQRIAYTMVVFMGLGSLLTGLAIYKPMQLSPLTQFLGGYSAARFEHFWLMIGFLLFFAIHIAQVARAGWNNFRAMITGRELAPVDAPLPEGEVAV